MDSFKLLMISAMYENGGNTTHRFLDGHPQMLVYPFESQIGTRNVNDYLSSMFPLKYRWPEFNLNDTPLNDYKSIIDEECKIRARTPFVSKFRDMPFDFSNDERLAIYEKIVNENGRSRGNNVAAFFIATFKAWKDYKKTDAQQLYVGYSPIIVIDTEKILEDLPGSHILHIVRNPWSAYADTKKRPVPMKLKDYILAWNINQHHALFFKQKFPENVHIIRIEDIFENSYEALGDLCKKLSVEPNESLKNPTWNSTLLNKVYPWGTIQKATHEYNIECANSLSASEKNDIRERTWQYLDIFNYSDFV